MKVIIEANIPFISGILEPFGITVAYLPPEAIDRHALADADALITRTRTRCDEALLSGTQCRFIATATIGTDHIDLQWCHDNGVTVANAPGCNAPAVAQYVHASIMTWLRKRADIKHISDLTLGVVGVGHVGSIVARWGRGLGMHVLQCDPPRAAVEGPDGFTDMADIARQADIVTFHTPLTHETHHYACKEWLDTLQRTPLLINSARGPVFDTSAVIAALDNGILSDVVVDCWENEPHIDAGLLRRAFIATPHIAGYSREGKMRATIMAVDALTRHFGLPSVEWPDCPMPAPELVSADSVIDSYAPLADTEALRSAPDRFEQLRNHYAYRDEVH